MIRVLKSFPTNDIAESDGGLVKAVHSAKDCDGGPCSIHNPTKSHKANKESWPHWWRFDKGLHHRTCIHGVGHPDPDDVTHLDKIGRLDTQHHHECCGCCNEEESS